MTKIKEIEKLMNEGKNYEEICKVLNTCNKGYIKNCLSYLQKNNRKNEKK